MKMSTKKPMLLRHEQSVHIQKLWDMRDGTYRLVIEEYDFKNECYLYPTSITYGLFSEAMTSFDRWQKYHEVKS